MKSLQVAMMIFVSLGTIIASTSVTFAVDDCSKDNALGCYTQALVRLQAAQDALTDARKDITAMQAQIDQLKSDAQANKSSLDGLDKRIGAVQDEAYKNVMKVWNRSPTARVNGGDEEGHRIPVGGGEDSTTCNPGEVVTGFGHGGGAKDLWVLCGRISAGW
jgi:hypothetical protein